MKLIRLTPEYEFNDFDCDDDDLSTRLMFFDMMEIE